MIHEAVEVLLELPKYVAGDVPEVEVYVDTAREAVSQIKSWMSDKPSNHLAQEVHAEQLRDLEGRIDLQAVERDLTVLEQKLGKVTYGNDYSQPCGGESFFEPVELPTYHPDDLAKHGWEGLTLSVYVDYLGIPPNSMYLPLVGALRGEQGKDRIGKGVAAVTQFRLSKKTEDIAYCLRLQHGLSQITHDDRLSKILGEYIGQCLGTSKRSKGS